MLLALLLAGCGSLSPSHMYDKVADVFSSKPASDEPFPNLATVPPRPTPPSLAERQQVSSGLIADRNNAQYTEQAVRNPLAAPPPSAATAPEQPVATTPPAPLPPAEAPATPGAPPVVRLVNGQLVASPGFFSTQAPAGSAPPAAAPPAPVATLQPGPTPSPPSTASANTVALNPGPIAPASPVEAAPVVTASAPPAPPPAPARVAAANPVPGASPEADIPEAPPPPPFALPSRAAELPPRPTIPAAPVAQPAAPAVAALPPPPVAPAARIAPKPPEGAGAKVAVIYFGDGKSGLDADAAKVVGQVAALYRQRGGVVRVLGYSGAPAPSGDVVRSSMASLNLATARADAVASGLIAQGVPRDAIQRSASTDAPPMIEGGRSTGIAGTRRAEIWLDY